MRNNAGKAPLLVQNGAVTIQEGINDYPTLQLTEYATVGRTRRIGDVLQYAGMSFILENISIEKCPIAVANARDKITYSYSHVSKKLLEYPIKTSVFLDQYKDQATRKTENSYFFPIGTLVAFAQSRIGFASVTPPAFLVELSKTPSPDETIDIKSFIDERLEILGFVYKFSSNSVSFVSLGSQGNISSNIVKNYTIGYGEISSYKDTNLTWNKRNENENQDLDLKRYRRLKDEPYVIYEGDHNPHLPPPETFDNTKVPRDLSIMFDNSGITKTCKITKYEWNQPSIELEATFGFAHAAIELVDDPNKPNVQSDTVIRLMSEDVINSGNAYQDVLSSIKSGKFGYPDDANFSNDIVWRLISVKEKRYIYEPLTVDISPRIKNNDGTFEQVRFAPGSDPITFSNTQVLTRELTEGWELRRFAQEDAQNWTEGSIQNWLGLATLIALKDTLTASSILAKQQYYWMLYYAKVNLEKYLYRKVPIWEQVDYAIEAFSKHYKDAEKVDWEVKFIPKNQLKEYQGTDSSEEVPVVVPDPNWSPQLMVLARSRLKMSVGLSGNPDYDPYKRNYFGTNPISIASGSEEYEYTKYSVLPSKNTKTNISDLFNSYVNVNQVISAVTTQLDLPGTFYQDKDYTNIPDYGIKGQDIPQLAPSRVLAPLPSTLANREDQYASLTSLRVAQDNSFKNHLTTNTFTLADGRPPSATTRKALFEEIQDDTKSNPYPNSVTLITSGNYAPFKPIIPSVSISNAENLNEAIKAARFKLTMEALNATASSVTIDFRTGVPKSLLNSRVRIPGVNDNWIVKASTQTVQFTDGKGFPQPIELECGILFDTGVSSRTVQIEDENNNGQDSIEVEINANVPNRYGTPIEQIPNGFGRWIDSN